jgi:hypothetical protein
LALRVGGQALELTVAIGGTADADGPAAFRPPTLMTHLRHRRVKTFAVQTLTP